MTFALPIQDSRLNEFWLFRDVFKITWFEIQDKLQKHSNYNKLYDDLKLAAQGKIIVLDAASDPVPFKTIETILVAGNLSEIAVTLVNDLELRFKYPNLNLRYFPKWILAAVEKFHDKNFKLFSSQWHSRSYKVSCMNRMVRKHRFYTWYLLQKHSWFNDCYKSFGGFNSCPKKSVGEYDRLEKMENVLPTECYNWFKNNLKQFPLSSEANFDWLNNLHDHLCPAFIDSYSNIVTETSIEVFCPTEKTTKCLQTGTLMFPVASPGHLKKLSAFGFIVDFDGIDYSWEGISNWQLRTEMCVQQVNCLYDNLEQIWHQNLPRLQHNQNLFASNDLINHCLHDVKDIVKIL